MLQPGFTSNTFRQLPSVEVIALARECRLTGIEWSADCHVLPGATEEAFALRQQCEEAGVESISYGSYYRCGVTPRHTFAAVLDTALALGAPVIRVWAGSESPPSSQWPVVVEDLRAICEQAAEKGLIVATEFHRGTLTETAESTTRLLDEVGASNLRTLWQPYLESTADASLAGLSEIAPALQHVHVFHRDPRHGFTRLPLAEGRADWARYLDFLRSLRRNLHLLLEFVPNDDPAQFRSDAAELHRWLADS